VADITWGQPRSAVDREIEMLEDAGVGWVRANASWIMLEPNGKGRIDQGALADYDYAIDRARAAGLKVLMPVSDGVPYWASADPDKYVDSDGKRHWKRLYQPADMADYGDIVHFVAEHFGDRVDTYEIWNEPNHPWFWASGPDPAAYVPMLKAGYQAVKSVDPTATVLLGGLSKSDYRFLEGVYEAGGGPYFDAVAVHPYTGGVDPTWAWNGSEVGESPDRLSWKSFPAIQEVKATMDANGDQDKQVWLTEFGYSTTTAAYGVSSEKQAAYLAKAYEYIEQFEWVHSMFWYSARNLPSAADSDSEPAQYGLMSTTFEPKPAYWALRDHALGQATDPVLGTPPPPKG
jgi:arabinogalactan endo-1,4-beta-galactosidase